MWARFAPNKSSIFSKKEQRKPEAVASGFSFVAGFPNMPIITVGFNAETDWKRRVKKRKKSIEGYEFKCEFFACALFSIEDFP